MIETEQADARARAASQQSREIGGGRRASEQAYKRGADSQRELRARTEARMRARRLLNLDRNGRPPVSAMQHVEILGDARTLSLGVRAEYLRFIGALRGDPCAECVDRRA